MTYITFVLFTICIYSKKNLFISEKRSATDYIEITYIRFISTGTQKLNI